MCESAYEIPRKSGFVWDGNRGGVAFFVCTELFGAAPTVCYVYNATGRTGD
jgi:hypothetical protein